MTVALENHLVGLLTGCVAHWRDGKYAQADCTLKFILDWAWERLTHTKQGCYSVLSRVSLSLLYFRQSQRMFTLSKNKISAINTPLRLSFCPNLGRKQPKQAQLCLWPKFSECAAVKSHLITE